MIVKTGVTKSLSRPHEVFAQQEVAATKPKAGANQGPRL